MTKHRQQPNRIPDDHDDSRWAFRYHRLAFYQGWVEGRKLKAHHLRDADAFCELSKELDDRGGRFDSLIRNGPARPARIKHYERVVKRLVEQGEQPLVEEIVEYQPIDEPFLKKRKVLVITTRLPMNDFQQENKVQVQPGFTTIEQKVIRACRPYLVVCARSRVLLANAVAAKLEPEFADRADVQFQAYKEPWYTQLQSVSPGARRRKVKSGPCRTAAYLLQLPEVPELNGADLLVMWGQAGTQTLAFAQRLRTDLSHLLDHYGFSMVEMVMPPTVGTQQWEENEMAPFELLDIVRDSEAHVLLQGVLLDANGRLRAPKAVRRGLPPASPMKQVRPKPTGAVHAPSDG